MEVPMDRHQAAALWLAQIAADVANYCDHAEHNESVERAWITNAARDLRALAIDVASLESVDLRRAYSARLGKLEQRNVLRSEFSFDGAAAVLDARTWRDLQLAQVEHDKVYHPDVIGLHKSEQLRHYALHLAKLAGAFARRAINGESTDEIRDRRLPDILLFGLKLSTVMGEALPDEPVSLRGGLESAGDAEGIGPLRQPSPELVDSF